MEPIFTPGQPDWKKYILLIINRPHELLLAPSHMRHATCRRFTRRTCKQIACICVSLQLVKVHAGVQHFDQTEAEH